MNDKEYLNFGGEYYYLDLDAVVNAIRMESLPIVTKSKTKGKKSEEERLDEYYSDIAINVSKWEIITKLIETLLQTGNEEIDMALGSKSIDKLSFSFKLAFNTLMVYNILKRIETE